MKLILVSLNAWILTPNEFKFIFSYYWIYGRRSNFSDWQEMLMTSDKHPVDFDWTDGCV